MKRLVIAMLVGLFLHQGTAAAQEGVQGGLKLVHRANDRFTLNFVEVDIREAVSAIAMERQINVTMDKEVAGIISVHLFHVTLDEALEAVTLAGGARVRKMQDLYHVYLPNQARDPYARDRSIEVFQLHYMGVDKVQGILQEITGADRVQTHEESRTVIVEDTPENLQRIRHLIHRWDEKPRQVMIEAMILEVVLTDDMALGVDWNVLLDKGALGTGGFARAVMQTAEGVSPVPGAGKGLFGNVIAGAGDPYQFTAAIDALQTVTRVNTLSTPKILAIHGKAARVQVGGKQGYKVTTVNDGVSSETIEFIDTGTILDLTPYMSEEDQILINVKPTINSVRIEQGIPVVSTTEVSTWLLARSGETVFIGGLIQDVRTRTQEGVPFLSRIPVLGWLFGGRKHSQQKSELVVLLTPRIVDGDLAALSEPGRTRVEEAEEKLFRKPQSGPRNAPVTDRRVSQ